MSPTIAGASENGPRRQALDGAEHGRMGIDVAGTADPMMKIVIAVRKNFLPYRSLSFRRWASRSWT